MPGSGDVFQHGVSLSALSFVPNRSASWRGSVLQATSVGWHSQSFYIFLTFATCFGMLMSLWTAIDIKTGRNMARFNYDQVVSQKALRSFHYLPPRSYLEYQSIACDLEMCWATTYVFFLRS